MRRVLTILLISSFLIGGIVFAQEEINQSSTFSPTTQMAIRYDKLDWQTYEFYADVNEDIAGLNYEWRVDEKEFFYTPTIRMFFESGVHDVTLIISDGLGSRKYDSVKLNINFWSLYNNYFLWSLYAVIVLIIIYYWIVKLIYLFNKKKIDRETNEFFSILETNGWIDHVINEIIKKHHNNKNKHKHIKFI